MAQDIQEIAPYMISEFQREDETGNTQTYLGVDYGAMDFVLANAINEQQIMIEKLSLQLKLQNEENELLKKRLETLESNYAARK